MIKYCLKQLIYFSLTPPIFVSLFILLKLFVIKWLRRGFSFFNFLPFLRILIIWKEILIIFRFFRYILYLKEFFVILLSFSILRKNLGGIYIIFIGIENVRRFELIIMFNKWFSIKKPTFVVNLHNKGTLFKMTWLLKIFFYFFHANLKNFHFLLLNLRLFYYY